jgi:hypothetical protein
MNEPICLLCNARGATHRPGRLGRYAQTCDRCEQRRGSHLARTKAEPAPERPAVERHAPSLTATGQVRALRWSARPR